MYTYISSIALFQVAYLRERYPVLDIEVDGGVGPSSIQACAEV